jgi:hemolysin activation/secretion protein
LLRSKRGASLYAIKPTCVRACSLWLLALCGTTSWAQTPAPQPSSEVAQEQRRQEERERILRSNQEHTPDVRLPKPETPQGLERLPSNEADCVDIKNVILVGDSADQFQWAIEAANHTADNIEDKTTGRCLGSRGVNLVMRRIQNAIIARGFIVARVLAGPQSQLAEGTLELTLFPGRIRRIQFAQGTDGRATKWNAVPVTSGDLLNLRDIEQALENFKRIPTVEADIQVVPAEGADTEPGQSDLVIKWGTSLNSL